MTIYKVITPESVADSNYCQFEYMLGWFDDQGSYQQKLFTDWENTTDFDNDVFNREDTNRIGAINQLESNRVTLFIENATLEDVQVYLSIFRAEKVYRIFKDGTLEELAPDSKTVQYEQRGLRYQFRFEVAATDTINLNVPTA